MSLLHVRCCAFVKEGVEAHVPLLHCLRCDCGMLPVSANVAWLTLVNDNAVEAIFAALCECASKHPDPEQEDDEGDFFFDEEEVRVGSVTTYGRVCKT